MTKIDRKLNIVIPVDLDDGSTVHVHSEPVNREIFETYFDIMSKTFTQVYMGGYGHVTGPRVAKLLLRKLAVQSNSWEGPGGVKDLIIEINRMTNVVFPGTSGWTTLPYEDAVRQKLFSDDDQSEIENAIVFFILASAIHRKAELRPILDQAMPMWGGLVTLLNCTAFAASLPISTTVGSTGARAKASSIPS